MPTLESEKRYFTPVARIRYAVAILVAHLFALAEDRDVPLSLSNAERDIASRAAALKEEEARVLSEQLAEVPVDTLARTYLSERFSGTTLAEKTPWLSLGLTSEELMEASTALMLRDACNAVRAHVLGPGIVSSVWDRTLPVALSGAPHLKSVFPRYDASRFTERFIASFTEPGEPLRLSVANGTTLSETMAEWLSSFSLLAERAATSRTHAQHLHASAALSRHLSSTLLHTSLDEVMPFIEEALLYARTQVRVMSRVERDPRIDELLAVALREGDGAGATRVAALYDVPLVDTELLRLTAKGLVIPEDAKRQLLARITEGKG